jgi:hypothetical protein
VTVPCCEPCRKTQTLDDEYFRNMITMRLDATSNPAAQQSIKVLYRALARPQARRSLQAILHSLRDVEFRSLSGLYLGHATSYDADLQRLYAVIRRTMLGLYWYEAGERLPDSHEARVYSADAIPAAERADAELFTTLFKEALRSSHRSSFGPDVFAYWFQRLPEPHADITLWAFGVYRCVGFLGITKPADEKL